MIDIVISLIGEVSPMLNVFIPFICIMNLVKSLLWG